MNSKIPFLRSALVLTVAAAFAACQDASLPSQPDSPTMPGPSTAFVDASTTGEEGFFWQPPIVKDAEGENNRDLSPVVVVCKAEFVRDEMFCDADPNTVTGGAPNEDALATLETVLSKEKEDRYEATFDSGEFPSLAVGDVVRVFAFRGDPLPGEEPAGWFDVELTDPDTKTKGNKKLTDDDEDGTLELQLGSSLPVAFRMSNALFCSQENIDDGYCFVGTFSNDEGGSGSSENGFIALDVDPDFIPPEKVAVGVDEVTFILERVERSEASGEGCLDGTTEFPLQERDLCVRGATAPDMMEFPFKADANGDSRVTLGMCFDGSGLTEDEEEQFQGWDADEIEINGDPVTVRTPLRGQPAPSELNCTGFVAAALDDGPVTRLARAGWQSVKNLFVPPAVALTTGAGHSVMTFSRIVYAHSLVVTDLSGDLTADPGDVVEVTVQVTRPPTTSNEDHFDSEAGSTPTSDYPDDDVLFDDGGDGPLDEAIAAATVGVNGIELEVSVDEGSVSTSTVMTATTTVDNVNVDGIATFDVTMPVAPSGPTVTVTVTGPALGSPLEIPIEVLQPPVIAGLAPSTTLASDVDYVFRGTGSTSPFSIVFTASDGDGSVVSTEVSAEDSEGTVTSLEDASGGGSFSVDPSPVIDPIDNVDLPDDEYTTTIAVTDDDGLSTTETIIYTLDTTAPAINVASIPSTSTQALTEDITVSGDVTDLNGIGEVDVRLLLDEDGDCSTQQDITTLGTEDVTAEVQADANGEFSTTFTVNHPGGDDVELAYCVDVIANDTAQDNGTGLKDAPNQRQFRGAGFTILWLAT